MVSTLFNIEGLAAKKIFNSSVRRRDCCAIAYVPKTSMIDSVQEESLFVKFPEIEMV